MAKVHPAYVMNAEQGTCAYTSIWQKNTVTEQSGNNKKIAEH